MRKTNTFALTRQNSRRRRPRQKLRQRQLRPRRRNRINRVGYLGKLCMIEMSISIGILIKAS